MATRIRPRRPSAQVVFFFRRLRTWAGSQKNRNSKVEHLLANKKSPTQQCHTNLVSLNRKMVRDALHWLVLLSRHRRRHKSKVFAFLKRPIAGRNKCVHILRRSWLRCAFSRWLRRSRWSLIIPMANRLAAERGWRSLDQNRRICLRLKWMDQRINEVNCGNSAQIGLRKHFSILLGVAKKCFRVIALCSEASRLEKCRGFSRFIHAIGNLRFRESIQSRITEKIREAKKSVSTPTQSKSEE